MDLISGLSFAVFFVLCLFLVAIRFLSNPLHSFSFSNATCLLNFFFECETFSQKKKNLIFQSARQVAGDKKQSEKKKNETKQ